MLKVNNENTGKSKLNFSVTDGTKDSRMDQGIWSASNFLKGCLPQILLGPFLNALSQMSFWDLHR